MDVVYVLGKGSLWKDNELRYSLRGIEKYLQGYNHVFIVGECPGWLSGVTHLPCDDIKSRKEWSIMRKVMTACDYAEVSENFLFFNDDHFALRPVQANQIKYWHSCSLEQKLPIVAGNNMRKVVNTMEVIPGFSLFFDIHVPMIYNKTEFKRIMSSPALKWEEKDYLIKTLYANLSMLQDVTYNIERMGDCKISTQIGYDLIRSKIKDRYFFSVGPKGVKADFKRLMTELYPDKSKYEQ
jgi:hypothetical protein